MVEKSSAFDEWAGTALIVAIDLYLRFITEQFFLCLCDSLKKFKEI